MLSEFFERILGVLPSVFSRKRELSYRDSCSDDDDDYGDMDIEEIVTSPKRPRMEPTFANSNHPSLRGLNKTGNYSANWIAKSKRRFHESFFTSADPNLTGAKSKIQQGFQEVITIDDDDDNDDGGGGSGVLPEIVVIPNDSTNGQENGTHKSLKRPPLSRRSVQEPHSRSRSMTESVKLASVRKKTNIGNGVRQSETRSPFRRSTPFKHRCSGVFNSSRIHDLTDRENGHFSGCGSTAQNSVRLDERAIYAKMLKNFYSSNSSETLGSVWNLCPQKMVDINDSRKENIVTKRKSPVSRLKLDMSYADNLKLRLYQRSNKADGPCVLKQCQDASDEVIWLSSSYRSSGVKMVERKISPCKSNLKPMAAEPSSPEIEVIASSPSKHKFGPKKEGPKKPIAGPKEPIAGPREKATTKEITVCREGKPVFKHSAFDDRKLQENPLLDSVYTNESWLSSIVNKYQSRDAEMNKKIENAEAVAAKHKKQLDAELAEKMKNVLRLQEIQHIEEDEEIQEIEKLVDLTPEMLNKIKEALRPTPPNEVLTEAFNLRITRRDMETLNRDNWLNDEVINFYFTLLYERGKLDNYPSVYVCNTFFYPKLISNGHDSLKRWTRKIDIFAHDLMLVPVHLGVHWCLAVVDFRCKKIQYYDSMSGKNQQCLNALKGYLEAESLDKKKVKLDTSEWSLEIVKEKPNQLNGSDCGMFTCKYAEYISRNAKITFTQEDMPYFRRRMVYEILTARLL